MKTILVTGCAGFIGSHVCELLLNEGYKVLGVDNFDPFYPKEIKEENLGNFLHHENFSFHQLDLCEGLDNITEDSIAAVIHLAAKAGVRPSIQDPAGYINVNINGTQRVHDFMLKRNIRKLIFASSSSVYGNNKKTPFSETDAVDHPISPYAFTKKSGELMNFAFHHLNKVDIINLRFFTVYGPRQRPDLAINKFIKLIHQNEKLVLFGDGNTARDYTYIEDTVAGIYAALKYCLTHESLYLTLNLGNNTPVKLSTLVDCLYAIMDKKKNIVYESMQPGDVDITYADINKAKDLLNYEPKVDIKTGLQKYIDWYRSRW